jgi:hypothetical protein
MSRRLDGGFNNAGLSSGERSRTEAPACTAPEQQEVSA